MFDFDGECGPVASVGLRDPEDDNCVLICRDHLEQLRSLRPYETRQLCRYLRAIFLRRRAA